MKDWNTAEIEATEYYFFCVIKRRFNIGRTTLERWRGSGRLIVCEDNETLVQGQRLIEAIQNRRYHGPKQKQKARSGDRALLQKGIMPKIGG